MSQPDDDKTQTFVPLTGGTMVSHYRIIEKIGAGGMGEIYLAEDTKLHRKVALKFLPLHLCQDPDCRARFTREAEAAAQLDHPNIVAVHEVGEFQGRPFFSMQHVEGQSLKEVIAGKTLPLDRILEIGIQVCDGLQAAHEKGIIHRDIKPSNILIDSHGRARIVDFGVASVMGSNHLTKTGSTLGTIGYMSPEQVRGETADHRTDLFSFGVVLYEMITGHAPFKSDSEAATLHAITNTKPELLARFRRDVPIELQTIVDKALDKDVATRYQHADDMAANLRAIQRHGVPVSRRKSTTKYWASLAVGGCLLIVLLICGYLYLQPRHLASVEKSIAVMPFTDMSPQRDQEYFCDGMTDELIGRLSNIHDLKVPSRTSVFLLRSKSLDIPEIGEQLGVQTLLEGSVQKSGEKLRITVQLINVSDGYHLWSQTFDRDLKDVFAIQDEISSAVIDRLRLTLFSKEEARMVRRPTTDIEAYNAYLRGWYFLNKFTDEDFRKAITYFEQATERDPYFALAYVGKAICYNDLFLNMFTSRSDSYEQARSAATKAITLGDGLGEAHSALGRIRLFFEWNLPGAEKEFKRAVELNPGSRECYTGYAMYLTIAGRFDEAIAGYKRACELDPVDPSISFMLADWGYEFAGRFLDAIIQNQKTLQMDPHYSNARISLAYSYALNGQSTEAVLLADSLIAADSAKAIAPYLIWVFAVSGQEDRARHLLSRLLEIRTQRYVDAYMIALVYAGLGDKNRAFEWLSKGFEERCSQMIFLPHDPMFKNLHSDARFQQLLGRIG